ncbi:MAG: Hsp20/alpha crystallin family protein [Candidatus Edwardsbacteria bacterium]
MQSENWKEDWRIGEKIDSFFQHLLHLYSPVGLQPEGFWRPFVDVYETDEEIIVEIELAGVKKKEVGVSVLENILTVKGIRTESGQAGERRHYHKIEICRGRFERHILLSQPIESKEITASYKEGILKIRLKKAKQSKEKTAAIAIE